MAVGSTRGGEEDEVEVEVEVGSVVVVATIAAATEASLLGRSLDGRGVREWPDHARKLQSFSGEVGRKELWQGA